MLPRRWEPTIEMRTLQSRMDRNYRIIRLDSESCGLTSRKVLSFSFLSVQYDVQLHNAEFQLLKVQLQYNLHNYNYSWSRGFREVKSLLMVGTCVYSISFHSIVGRFLALSLFSTLGRSGMLSRTIMVEVSSNHFVRIQCWWLA